MKRRLTLVAPVLWLSLAAFDRLAVPHGGAHTAAKAGFLGSLKTMPGFYGLLGLFGAAALIAVAKALGTLLHRNEGYELDRD